MNIKHSITTAALLPLALLTAGNANAFFGDFSQETDGISITSSNFNNATLLNEVKVVCPNSGWLLAQADATFQLEATAVGSTVWIRYSITNDGDNGIDSSHDRNLQAYVLESAHAVPGSIMRMDRCAAGEEISYRFVAQRVSNAESTTAAFGARMHVQFFRREI
ncbi:MAG: hypothetical protein AAF184_21120 [Pseudomonadota bacterium]